MVERDRPVRSRTVGNRSSLSVSTRSRLWATRGVSPLASGMRRAWPLAITWSLASTRMGPLVFVGSGEHMQIEDDQVVFNVVPRSDNVARYERRCARNAVARCQPYRSAT